MEYEGDSTYRIDMSGQLRTAELKQRESELAAEIRRVGRVKLLFVLKNFSGWAPEDDWNDLTFYVKHGDEVDRIAIVGDEKWRNHALMFAGAGLRRGPVEYFSANALASARQWLSE
jgi:hypothetical protein